MVRSCGYHSYNCKEVTNLFAVQTKMEDMSLRKETEHGCIVSGKTFELLLPEIAHYRQCDRRILLTFDQAKARA